MFKRALLLAIFSIFAFASPASAQVAISQQCSLEKPVDEGGLHFNQCPFGTATNFLITQGYNGARLDQDVDLSHTPMNLYNDNLCRYIDARGTTASLFIPFNSQAEWSAFLNNAPEGVHTANCCLPRPLKLSDVPAITTVPNVQTCSTGWKFDGLANPSDFTKIIATAAGNTPTSGFNLANGTTEDPNYPITGLPVQRDDILATLPTGSRANQSYYARYSCVTTSGNTTSTAYQLVQFALQCTSGNWQYTGSGCTSGTIALFSELCPNGGSGSIFKQVVRACPSGDVTVQELSNTCSAQCVPGQVGGPFAVDCPGDQTGMITRGNFRQCPSGTIVTQEISNTCAPAGNTCNTPPANICPQGSTATGSSVNGQCQYTCTGGTCQTGNVDLGITTSQCPNGQAGIIQTHQFRSCTNTNNQCVCGLAATEEDNCSANGICVGAPNSCAAGQTQVCTPSGPGGQCNCLCQPDNSGNGNGSGAECGKANITQRIETCPAGQTGQKLYQRVKTCGAANPPSNTCQCSTIEQLINNSCTAAPACVPLTDLGNSNKACPAGQTGTVIVNTKKICVSQNNQCVCHNEETEVTRACEGNMTCIPSTDLGNSNKACPAGQTGTMVVNTKKICVSQNNQCVCHNEETTVSTTCTPTGPTCVPSTDLGNSNKACPAGQTGTMVVNTKKICVSQNNQCVCHNEETAVSNTCTGTNPPTCVPTTDLGTVTKACPAGQTGQIVEKTQKICVTQNNQCVCHIEKNTVSNTCTGTNPPPQCVPSTDLGTETRQCPTGQTGAITVKRVKVCTLCNNNTQCSCSVQEVPVSNTCTTGGQCTPGTRTETSACPAGQTGSIVKTIKKICDCPGGREEVIGVQNNCSVTLPQCVPTQNVQNLGCPAGYTGAHTRTTTHICDTPDTGHDQVTESNTCTPPANQCTPSTRTENVACPSGYSGTHTRTIKHICDCPGGRDVVINDNNQCRKQDQCKSWSRDDDMGCPSGYSGYNKRTTRHICDCPGGRDVMSYNNTCKPSHGGGHDNDNDHDHNGNWGHGKDYSHGLGKILDWLFNWWH